MCIRDRDQPLKPDKALRRDFFYAAETAVKTKDISNEGFLISVPTGKPIEKARLVIGVHRDGGMEQPLALDFNGKSASTNQKWAGEIKNLFEPVTVNIPRSMIQENNRIKIGDQEGLTITSIHMEIDTVTN